MTASRPPAPGRAPGAVGPEDRRPVAGHRPAGGARPDVVPGRRDEDMQQLGAADAVDDLEAERVVDPLPGRERDVLPRADGRPDPGELVDLARAEDLLVRRR